MVIHALGIDDYDSVMDLWLRSGLSSLRPTGRDSREAFARPFSDTVWQTALGLENDGKLVGAVVATHDGRKGWVNRLAIDPAERRRGFAKMLIAAAEDALRAQGIQVIAALIERDNVNSLALFQDLGYHLHDDILYLSKRDRTEA